MAKVQPIRRIAIIGFGEAGGILASDFAKQGIQVSIFDILLKSRRHRMPMLTKARRIGVEAAPDVKHCLSSADVVISAVTASSALAVAKQAASILEEWQIFLDINSVSPKTKRRSAGYIERSRAHYVEAAVMEAVPRHRLRVPILLGGGYAKATSKRLQSIGMNTNPLSAEIGVVSAVKMCRSIMVKGLEALAVECLFASRRYGAEGAVLESLAATYPGIGWKDKLPDYLVGRVAEHGCRRAAEMREVAKALKDVNIKPLMALATAERQDWLVGAMAKRLVHFDAERPFSWRVLADSVVRQRLRSSLHK